VDQAAREGKLVALTKHSATQYQEEERILVRCKWNSAALVNSWRVKSGVSLVLKSVKPQYPVRINEFRDEV
jgi:hypothetical protein